MRRSNRKPTLTPDDYDEVYCGYCGYGNDPSVRGTGGEFKEVTSTISISGITNYTHPGTGEEVEKQNDDSGGCAFCNSPEWVRGGRISWGKFRPRRR
jgi:hypothetical protein